MQYTTLFARRNLFIDSSRNQSGLNENKGSDREQQNKRSTKIFDEASRHRKQRHQSSGSDVYSLSTIDDVLEDENSDWFFEKLLDKFEDIRTKKVHGYDQSRSNAFNVSTNLGPERIIERRYYIKKEGSLPKYNQLTSTNDLTQYCDKTRQISGVSSATACSQCLSSTTTFVESLCYESNLLRNEINDLRDNIVQLQTSQEQFFKQLKTQFQSNTNATTISENFLQATTLPEQLPAGKVPSHTSVSAPSSNAALSRTTSTGSVASNTTVSNGNSNPALKSKNNTNVQSLNKLATEVPPIAEFLATKNSAISPTPQIKENTHVKVLPATSSPQITEFIAEKKISVPPTPPATQFIALKTQSIQSESPKNVSHDSKSLTAASTPTNAKVALQRNPSITSESSEDIVTKPIAIKPVTNTNLVLKSPLTIRTPTTTPLAVQNIQSIPFTKTNNNLHSEFRSSSATSTPINTTVVRQRSPSSASESLEKISVRSTDTKLSSIPQTAPTSTSTTPKLISTVTTSSVNQFVTQKVESIPLTTTNNTVYGDSRSSSAASSPRNAKESPRQSSSSDSESSTTITAMPLKTKPPLIPRMPLVNGNNVSQSSSMLATQSINNSTNSNAPSILSTPSANNYVIPKPPSEISIPFLTQFVAPKNPSISNPSTSFSVLSAPSMPSASKSIYENELAHRNELSPRSQIVASSGTTHKSSDSSTGSSSPELVRSVPQQITKIPSATLKDNELTALAQYSSQLELSGFAPSTTPTIYNPNTSDMFWESVDEYIANFKTTNSVITALTTMPRATDEHAYRLNNSIKRLSDKYNLEIKPQEIIQSSAPLIMPPLDTLP